MATYTITRQSGVNAPGCTSWRIISYDRSPRVLVSSRPKRYKLQLRQNSMELRDERVQPSQYWNVQCGSSMIARVGLSTTNRNIVGYPAVYSRAYGKFRENAWSASKGALAVDFGERKDTMEMITEALGTLAKAALQVKRGKLKAAAQTLKLYAIPKGASPKDAFLSNWMRYRYGFLPLMSSVTAYASLVERPSKLFVEGTSALPFSWKGWNTQFYNTSSELYGVTRVTVKGGVSVESPVLVKLHDLGLINPATVVWELIPLSFVADWFLGIGDWLDSFTDFVGLKFDDTAVTFTCKGTEFLSAKSIQANNVPGRTIYPGLWVTFDSVFKERVKVAKPPVPDLQFGTGLNLKRAIDSVALLSNLLRR